MRIRSGLLVLLLALVALGACGDDDDDVTVDDEPAAGTEHVLTADDDQSDLTVAVGDTVVVVLSECPSCGYQWRDIGSTIQGGYGTLEVLGDVLGESDNEAGETGGDVDHTFRYGAVAEGGVNLELGYFSPGDADAPEETFIVSVAVEAAS